MPYPWECIDCTHMDPYDKKWNKFYCLYNHYYVEANSPSCRHFNKKKMPSTCYLTTIACDILGYKDDAYPLQTLRDFRDNYMKMNSEYDQVLEDYDIVGPMICDKLEEDENNVEVARSMMNNYIAPAVMLIDDKHYDYAIRLYECMTIDLMHHYNIDESVLKGEYKVRKRER